VSAVKPSVCGRCGGVNGAHYLTCPVLRLAAGYRPSTDPEVTW
jgi:hypothetical protein